VQEGRLYFISIINLFNGIKIMKAECFADTLESFIYLLEKIKQKENSFIDDEKELIRDLCDNDEDGEHWHRVFMNIKKIYDILEN